VAKEKIPTKWIDIVNTYVELRPIRNDASHKRAIEIIEVFAGLQNMNKAQSDYFDILTDIIVKYEKVRWPIH
jgi:antitoxin component HigA of HigAB toxin-antitoxin module